MRAKYPNLDTDFKKRNQALQGERDASMQSNLIVKRQMVVAAMEFKNNVFAEMEKRYGKGWGNLFAEYEATMKLAGS